MSGQGGQDAKFFTRGKIQVRDYYYVTTGNAGMNSGHAEIPRRAGGRGEQGQEVHEAQDGAEEGCRQYHDGQ